MVEGFHPLHEACFETGPFRTQHHAGNDVEGDQPLGAVFLPLAVDREGDADPAKQQLCLCAAGGEKPGGRRGEPARDLAVDRPDRAVGQGHFIETTRLWHLPALRSVPPKVVIMVCGVRPFPHVCPYRSKSSG